ncbi:hypothetical protein [Thermogemmatispora sp.]|uniref:hypothetical protein n=1 Tax=Thermogemmatispora sp. TaxID=1968838 RepID=UPI0035E43448
MQSPEPAEASQGGGQAGHEPEQKAAAGALPASAPEAAARQGEAQPEGQGQPLSPAASESAGDFVYPPPPAFYERLVPATDRRQPWVQAGAASHIGQAGSAPASSQPPFPPARPPSPPLTAPEAPGPTGAAPFVPPPPATSSAGRPPGLAPVSATPVRRSRRLIWISLAILAVALLACIGTAAWTFVGSLRQIQQQYNGLTALVDDYYGDIQRQDYVHAFQDLQPGGFHAQLTLQEFVQEGHDFDSRYGPVLSYQIRSLPNFGLDEGPTYTVEVDVTRSHLSYTVLLTVRQVGSGWKIIDFDRL